MNIVNEIILKLLYLKPSTKYNIQILKYFLQTNIKNYFNDSDKHDITINLEKKALEITNLNTKEEYILTKDQNTINFINKNNNELLFHLKNNNNYYSNTTNNNTTIIINNNKYTIINHNQLSEIIILTDLKIKTKEKNYFELKILPQNKTKIIVKVNIKM